MSFPHFCFDHGASQVTHKMRPASGWGVVVCCGGHRGSGLQWNLTGQCWRIASAGSLACWCIWELWWRRWLMRCSVSQALRLNILRKLWSQSKPEGCVLCMLWERKARRMDERERIFRGFLMLKTWQNQILGQAHINKQSLFCWV